jgi:two-component system sensor histidine kinase MtrB
VTNGVPQPERLASVAGPEEFLAIAAHELRGPITAVVGAAETLDEGWQELPEGDRRQLVAVLVRQSRRLSRLVDELLELSRLEAGVVPFVARPVEVAPEAETAREEAGVAGVVVACRPGLRVMADPDHLRRILVNLLVNAGKHGAHPIMVDAEPLGDQVEVRVVDAGPGVPSEFVPRLFDRFTRATRAGSEGSGLGLAIVDGLARLGGGDVSYRPAPAGGAVFAVRLPAG